MLNENLIDENLLERALQVATNHLKDTPFDHEVLFQLGNIYFVRGEYEEAFKNYQKASNLLPQVACYAINQGHALRMLGELEQATTVYQSVLHFNPRYADAHFYIGLIYFENRDFDHAFSCFSQALLINPRYAAPRYYLGKLHQEMGEFRQAMNEFRRVIEECLGKNIHEISITVNCGLIFSDAGLLEESEKYYRKLLKEHPDFADLHLQLGLVLKKLNKVDEALDEFHFAIKLNPQYMEARRKYWESAR
ncbi:MAG: tetratricopeptide repeat protein [Candidatus Riflebacteria bacterium]|nr:tetratricopeptide repeat protein [Candidatus Riflebacteria bacterium]